MKLEDLISELEDVYCGTVGFEFTHLLVLDDGEWLLARIEKRFAGDAHFSSAQRLGFLRKTIEAEAFEDALHKKYVGHKRFSVQGGETVIPMLYLVLEEAAGYGIREVIVGMSHRGRL